MVRRGVGGVPLDTDAARESVRERRDLLDTVSACADAVTADWESDAISDSERITGPLRALLSEAGVLDTLPVVLADAVDAAGGSLEAQPVAAPPYVVVTSRGPLLRATLGDDRLLVRLDCFRVTDDGYERRDGVDVTVSLA